MWGTCDLSNLPLNGERDLLLNVAIIIGAPQVRDVPDSGIDGRHCLLGKKLSWIRLLAQLRCPSLL